LVAVAVASFGCGGEEPPVNDDPGANIYVPDVVVPHDLTVTEGGYTTFVAGLGAGEERTGQLSCQDTPRDKIVLTPRTLDLGTG
jgi:hypothetical protein